MIDRQFTRFVQEVMDALDGVPLRRQKFNHRKGGFRLPFFDIWIYGLLVMKYRSIALLGSAIIYRRILNWRVIP